MATFVISTDGCVTRRLRKLAKRHGFSDMRVAEAAAVFACEHEAEFDAFVAALAERFAPRPKTDPK